MEKRHSLLGNSSAGTRGIERLYNRGTEYLVEIDIGTPAQKFNLSLDTGSSTLWVSSTECNGPDCPHELFDVSASISARETGVPFQLVYGIGAVNGTYYLETVTLANITVLNQTVGVVDEVSQKAYGFIGFGFPAMNALRGYELDVPLAFNLANNKVIPEPIFSIYLNSSYEYGYSGEIVLGGIDKSKYTGSLTYVPVVNYTIPPTEDPEQYQDEYLYWTVGGAGIKTSTGLNVDFDIMEKFILDTGTTLTFGPKNVTDLIVESITGIDAQELYDEEFEMYSIDCALASSNYTIDFAIVTDFQSPTSDPLIMAVSLRELLIPYDADIPELATVCFFGMAPIPASASVNLYFGQYILGQTVLRSFYTVYDMAQYQVGVAPAIFSQSSDELGGN
ncbi:aspartic peptidase domain-containing protein [Fennellomyces sp. T-0311]|nr:aspartic peptidase domain-containing protein [Fennellomyces sp. T-0311]